MALEAVFGTLGKCHESGENVNCFQNKAPPGDQQFMEPIFREVKYLKFFPLLNRSSLSNQKQFEIQIPKFTQCYNSKNKMIFFLLKTPVKFSEK